MRPYGVDEHRYGSRHTAYRETSITDGRSEPREDSAAERAVKWETEPMVSLSPVHITISDEAYRLYSQFSESESTGEERSAKSTHDDVERSTSHVVSRAQAAYSQAQAHAARLLALS
ncbi:hypothetical protein [Alicyclobacillus vulcanalis]|uniref:Uncharacterized protein n=1 Tax=Alicyclobacillus vulcanalis TaxID=252246 RepID=A0A1N7MP20_9BACL|nr:hypothetical protein [Alicyclobacillus vulcanalis]SIS87895.1 hypothetical protein SAMN05421799_1063 [Alicyclobacillus vulcanalis]